MALMKIGEISNIKLMDVVHLYTFFSETLRWKEDEFVKRTKNKFDGCLNSVCQVSISSNFILLPKHFYLYPPRCIRDLMEKGIIDTKLAERIEPEHFTIYNVYEFKSSKDSCDLIGEAEINIKFERLSEDKGKVGLSSMYTGITIYDFDENCKYKGIQTGNIYLDFLRYRRLAIILRDDIETLSKVMGEDYMEYRYDVFSSSNEVLLGAEEIERTFLNFLNLAYALYTGGVNVNAPEYALFEPVIEVFREAGNTFEDVIATIRAFATIMI